MRYVCLFILIFILAFPAVCGSVSSTVSGELATDAPMEFTSLEIELQTPEIKACPRNVHTCRQMDASTSEVSRKDSIFSMCGRRWEKLCIGKSFRFKPSINACTFAFIR